MNPAVGTTCASRAVQRQLPLLLTLERMLLAPRLLRQALPVLLPAAPLAPVVCCTPWAYRLAGNFAQSHGISLKAKDESTRSSLGLHVDRHALPSMYLLVQHWGRVDFSAQGILLKGKDRPIEKQAGKEFT